MSNPTTPTDAEDDDLDGIEETPAEPLSGIHALEATDADAGLRLDRFLANHLTGLSRARIQTLIRQGNVEGPEGVLDAINLHTLIGPFSSANIWLGAAAGIGMIALAWWLRRWRDDS